MLETDYHYNSPYQQQAIYYNSHPRALCLHTIQLEIMRHNDYQEPRDNNQDYILALATFVTRK